MKKILALLLALTMAFALTACSQPKTEDPKKTDEPEKTPTATVPSGVEDGVLTVGMECKYTPYNWTQMDDSNGGVAIVNNPGRYANGYDVMMAQKICDANNWKLEIMAIEWDGLTPALKSNTIDVAIAGQSMTDSRMAEVDMAGPYFYASIVCVTKADGPLANIKGVSELTGTCTAQTGTIWYDTCLPQLKNVDIQTETADAPAMIMAVESGTVDFVCTDIPTARAAVAAYPDLKILDFTDQEDNFKVDQGDINIGMSVVKGNTTLLNNINDVLKNMTEKDFDDLMAQAISAQPTI